MATTGRVGLGSTTFNSSERFRVYHREDGLVDATVYNDSTGANAAARFLAHNGGSVLAVEKFGNGVVGTGARRAGFGVLADSGLGINIAAGGGTGIVALYTGGFDASNERARLDVSGNLGIGTTGPVARLHVSSGGLLVDGSTGDAGGVSGAGTRFMWVPSSAAIRAGSVPGAEWNPANIGAYSVAFGSSTQASGPASVVGGGVGNVAASLASAIAGGRYNSAGANGAFIGGGEGNRALSTYDTVGGGIQNTANGGQATVAGGQTNTATGNVASVVGGYANNASGGAASILGGQSNTASGTFASILGGESNLAAGGYSLAAGRRARVSGRGSFAWADSQNADLLAGVTDQFRVRAQGGFYVDSSSVSLVHGGATRLFIQSDGNVGVGTSAPSELFEVGAGTLTVAGTGKVGIGIGPAAYLHVFPSGPADLALRVESPALAAYAASTVAVVQGGPASAFSAAVLQVQSRQGDSAAYRLLDVYNDAGVSPVSKFLVRGDGRVGVGVSAPLELVDVAGGVRLGNTSGTNAGTLRWTGTDFEGYTGSAWTSLTSGGSAGGWTDDGTIVRLTAGGDNVVIASTLTVQGNAFSVGGSTLAVSGGRVGIGTTSPAAGSVFTSSGSVVVQSTSSTGAHAIQSWRDDSGMDVMKVEQGGRVAIGPYGAATGLEIRTTAPLSWGSGSTPVEYGRLSWTALGPGVALVSAVSGKNLHLDTTGVGVFLDSSARGVGVGTTSPAAGLHVSSSIVASGAQGTVAISGAGTRFMWVPSSAAIRAGAVGYSEWDPANIGAYSVAFGTGSRASGTASVVSGGRENRAVQIYGTVSGGHRNRADSSFDTVSGGDTNVASGGNSTVGGGDLNTASGGRAVIAGGGSNQATQTYSTIGGGSSNRATGTTSTVAGGSDNTAGGDYAAVPGGYQNLAQGDYSLAVGYQARATGRGSFVWSDSQGTPLQSDTTDHFLVRAQGGFYVRSSSLAVAGTGGTLYTVDATSAHFKVPIYDQTGALVAGGGGGGWTDDGTVVRLTAAGDNVVVQSTLTVQGGAFSVAGSTLVVSGGLVGIGTTSPAQELHVKSGGETVVRLEGGAGFFDLHADNNDSLFRIYEGVNPRLAIRSGNIGLGTIAPATTLHVSSGGILADGSTGAAGGVSGAGTRFMWIPSSAAIRAGAVSGSEWDAGSIAPFSVAFGQNNISSGTHNAVGGGFGNQAHGIYSVISGGSGNVSGGMWGEYTSVGGGRDNRSVHWYTTVAGGYNNVANNFYGTVGGGRDNTASGNDASTVAGGYLNTASNDDSTVGGGQSNRASGSAAAVAGGFGNNASGLRSAVPGGYLNLAQGDYSFAAGRRAKASAQGSFVWADSQDADLLAGVTDQFRIRAQGGFYVNSSSLALVGTAGTLYTVDASSAHFKVPIYDQSGALVAGGGGSGWTDDGTVVRLTAAGDNVVVQSTLTVQGGAFSVGGSTLAVSGGQLGLGTTSPLADLPSGFNPIPESRVLQLRGASGGSSDSAVLIRPRTGEEIGLDLWSDGSSGTGYIDSRYDLTGGDIRFRTQTRTSPLEVLSLLHDGRVGVGVTTPSAQLHVSSSILASGNLGAPSISGAGTRFMWIPSSAAVRAGAVDGTQWDAGSIGIYSAAFGQNNVASAGYAVVAGGQNNSASGLQSSVGGGASNTASAQYSRIGGGVSNSASGNQSVIAGGQSNRVTVAWSAVGGGSANTASGQYASVPGGQSNLAYGQWSLAAGHRAKVSAAGAFAWADSQAADLLANVTDQFRVRAQGGFQVDTTSITMVHAAAGAVFTVDGSSATVFGLSVVGAKTAAELRALACPSSRCMAFNTTDFDLYTSTGTGVCQWRNSRTGVGP